MRKVPIMNHFVCLDCGGFEQGDENSSMINRCNACLEIEHNTMLSDVTDKICDN